MFACEPRERDGLRYLVPAAGFRQLLRAIDGAPSAVEVPGSSDCRPPSRAAALLQELFESIERARCRPQARNGAVAARRPTIEWRPPGSCRAGPFAPATAPGLAPRSARRGCSRRGPRRFCARHAAHADGKCQSQGSECSVRGAWGRKRTDPSRPGLLQRIAVWSSLPPSCRRRLLRPDRGTCCRSRWLPHTPPGFRARRGLAPAARGRAGSPEPGREAPATIRALELLMPAAEGRSLSKTRSRPRVIAGKLWITRLIDGHRVVRPADVGAAPPGSIGGQPRPISVIDRRTSRAVRDDAESSFRGADEASAAAVVRMLARTSIRPGTYQASHSSRSARSRPTVARRRANCAARAATAAPLRPEPQARRGSSHNRSPLRALRRHPRDAARRRRYLRAATSRARRPRPEPRVIVP